jgi:hypothetical protein
MTARRAGRSDLGSRLILPEAPRRYKEEFVMDDYELTVGRLTELIAEGLARDYDLDLGEFVFPEGDDLYTRVEAIVVLVGEQIEEVLEQPDTDRCDC